MTNKGAGAGRRYVEEGGAISDMTAVQDGFGNKDVSRRDVLKLSGLTAALAAGMTGQAFLAGCSKDDDLYKGYKKLADASYDASDFVLVSDVVPDAIQEIRYFGTYNFVGERIDGYLEPVAILCKQAAAALKTASDVAIAKGYRLKIWDAYRPQRGVNHFERWAEDVADVRMKAFFYPDLDKSVLFDQGYIDHRSGHSRGSTVDITLFDMATGREIDAGGPFDFFGELSHPDYTAITDEQYANRMLLRDIMVGAGYTPLDTEWWHFRLADEPYPDTFFDFPNCAAAVK